MPASIFVLNPTNEKNLINKNNMAWEDKSLLIYAKIFEALGQESRLEVFNLICQAGKKGVRPKEIVEQLGIDGGTLHFHLNRLMAVNLITTKQNASRGVYCLNQSAPKELLGLFIESCYAHHGN